MNQEKKIQVNKICPQCKESKIICMKEEEKKNYSLYLSGVGLIQDMLSGIPAPERELLKGGMCSNCWKKIFGPPCGK